MLLGKVLETRDSHSIELRVVRDNEGTKKSVCPLRSIVCVVPVCAYLIQGEVISKVGVGDNGTLSQLGHSVHLGRANHVLTVPVNRNSLCREIVDHRHLQVLAISSYNGRSGYLVVDCDHRASL